jgi:hypothetical protein
MNQGIEGGILVGSEGAEESRLPGLVNVNEKLLNIAQSK